MKLRLLRHATVVLDYAGRKLLVDPVLNPAGARPPIPTKAVDRDRRNPLVELPVSSAELQEIIASLDGALLTHLHKDHFDEAAARLLPKDLPLLCQPEDGPKLREMGFSTLLPIEQALDWQGIRFARTRCHHGGILVRRQMGPVSGFILAAPGEPTLYVAGDTVWCGHVGQALRRFKPEVTVVNAGAAQLKKGRSITMNSRDIEKVCKAAPWTEVIAVHLEAINHCLLNREELRTLVGEKKLDVRVPKDGEKIEYNE